MESLNEIYDNLLLKNGSFELKYNDHFGDNFLSNRDCQYVYVFYNQYTKLCKIGTTENINRRWIDISNASGMKVWKVLTIALEADCDLSGKETEKLLHEYFKDKRKIGEWFELTIRDLIKIRYLFYHIEGQDIEDAIRECFCKKKY